MTRGINKVMILGTLGSDPVFKQLSDSIGVTNLSLATNESWKDKQSNKIQSRTEWHKVTIFGKAAEVAHEYLSKGVQVYVEGRLKTNKWKDEHGNTRSSTEIVVDHPSNLHLIGTNKTGSFNSAVAESDSQLINKASPQTGNKTSTKLETRAAPEPQTQPQMVTLEKGSVPF